MSRLNPRPSHTNLVGGVGITCQWVLQPSVQLELKTTVLVVLPPCEKRQLGDCNSASLLNQMVGPSILLIASSRVSKPRVTLYCVYERQWGFQNIEGGRIFFF